MRQVARHRGLMTAETYPLSTKERALLAREHVESGEDGRHRSYIVGGARQEPKLGEARITTARIDRGTCLHSGRDVGLARPVTSRIRYDRLPTERPNSRSRDLDRLSPV